jgi:sugar lactone lactonase YvrE
VRKTVLIIFFAFAISFSNKLFAQSAPVITYITPQYFATGNAVSIAPNNTGGTIAPATYGTVATFAGSTTGASGQGNFTGTAATFNHPKYITGDAAGNLYVADFGNNSIRKITPAGVVSTFAGSLTGVSGSSDSPTGTSATFNGPNGIAVDASGNLYVSDFGNNSIRKITSAGAVTTFKTGLTGPAGLCLDATATFLYVAEQSSNDVKKITVATPATVVTYGVPGTPGNQNGTSAANQRYRNPTDVKMDAAGNVYIVDAGNHCIRKLVGNVSSTLSGPTTNPGTTGYVNGAGTVAKFNAPVGLAVDGYANCNLYVGDYGNNDIRMITSAGVASLLTGSSTQASGRADGTAAAATFSNPSSAYVSPAGIIYVTDYANNSIRQIAITGYSITPALPAGLSFDVTTGVISGTATTVGNTTHTTTGRNYYGTSTSPSLSITVTNTPALSNYSPSTRNYVANTVMSLAPVNTGGTVPGNAYSTVSNVIGSGTAGTTNGTRTASRFTGPTGITIDLGGLMYIADKGNQLIRKVPLTGNLTTLAGTVSATGNVDGTGTGASFNNPSDITADAAGNLYVADMGNHKIRKIIASTGVVSTVAGNGTSGFINNTGTNARFNTPTGVVYDPVTGNIYVADKGNNAIRMVTPAGVVTTIAGSGAIGHADLTGTSATFNHPSTVAVDAAGDIFVADKDNNLIRKINHTTLAVSTFAGDYTVSPAASVDGVGTLANFNGPDGITIDRSGNIYVSEKSGNKIRMITPAGKVTTVAGTGVAGVGIGLGTVATFSSPVGMDVDPTTGNIMVADSANHRIRQLIGTGFSLSPTTLPIGMTFAPATGTISGTPTVSTDPVMYTITGFNIVGSSAATVTISTSLAAPSLVYTTPVSLLVGTNIGTAPNPSVTPVISGGGAIPNTTYGAINATFVPTGSNINNPRGFAPDGTGAFYEADFGGNAIYLIPSTGGTVTTPIAGSTTGISGQVDANGTAARFNGPSDIVYDGSTYYYIVDNGANTIRQMTNSPYTVNTIAGINGTAVEGDNTTGTLATFNKPYGITYDGAGFLYVTDNIGNTVRKISTTAPFAVTTIVSTGLNAPTGITYDGNGFLYIANTGGNTILKVATTGGTPTVFAGSGTAGSANGTGIAATFSSPTGVAFDASGNLLVSDRATAIIRSITPAGVVSTFLASVGTPYGIATDNKGNLFIGDNNAASSTIRQVYLTGLTITPTLPSGVSIATTTGALSGKSNTVSVAATDYTITAYNASGSSRTVLNMTWYKQFAWKGTTSDPTVNSNWVPTGLPVDGDEISIGTTQAIGVGGNPVFAVTRGLGAIIMGTGGGATKPPGIIVNNNIVLTISGDITYQSSNTTGTGSTAAVATIAGATAGVGTVKAANLIITTPTAATSTSTYPMSLTSSVGTLTLTGGISLTSKKNTGTQNATFTISGGTVTVPGKITTSNAVGSTSTISMTGGTLKLADPDPLSGLSSTVTNVLSLTGGTFEYSGADQTVYSHSSVPKLSGGGIASYNHIKFSGTGIKTVATGNLNIAGDFTNSLTNDGVTTFVDLSDPSINVNFTGTTQTLVGGAGTGTEFLNVTFSGAGTKTMSSGKFAVGSAGVLTIGGTNAATILDAGTNLLTLRSDADGSATVAEITTSGQKIDGTVNVQRYVTGNDNLLYRGYRLFSSPIADPTSPSFANYNLSYLFNSGTYLTGASGGGFNAVGNPTMYFYREDIAPNNSSFTSGNYRAITKIDNSTHLYTIGTVDNDKDLSVGNGIMFFYRGNPGTNTSTPPSSLTLSSLGHLNQGKITVRPWFRSVDTLSYNDAIVTDPRYNIKGFNLVGNPYPSSINWNKVLTGTATSGIYAPNTDQTVYIYNVKTKNYDTYSASTGLGSNGLNNIIPQGQGFYVRATNRQAQLIFNESAKITDQPDSLLLNAAPASIAKAYLRLQLEKDNINKDETILLFNSAAKAAYVAKEDAVYFRGSGVVSFSNRSSDNRALCINQLPFPQTVQVVPLNVNVTTSGVYKINLTEISNIPNIYDIWLMDGYTKDSLDIKHSPTYSFNTTSDTATYGSNRFKLVIRQNAALAVRLLSFTGIKGIADVKLTWTAENEGSHTTYVLQRSTNGGASFTTLDSLTSAGFGTYDDLDPNPVAGKNLYRLKQIDVLGNVTYSSVVEINITTPTTGNNPHNAILVYPNPARHNLAVLIKPVKNNASNSYKITITNNMGMVVRTSTTNLPLWLTDVVGLLPGTYFLNVTNIIDNTLIGQTTFIKL